MTFDRPHKIVSFLIFYFIYGKTTNMIQSEKQQLHYGEKLVLRNQQYLKHVLLQAYYPAYQHEMPQLYGIHENLSTYHK